MLALRLINRRRVHLIGSMLLPMSINVVWGQMRSFTYFVGLDPFHGPIRAANAALPVKEGSQLILGHRFGPLRLDRVGRILRWRDGVGYSFSDLSRNGNHAGFPHVFTYAIYPRGDKGCRLTITVRGHWTAAWLPRCIIRRWLLWVLGHTLHSVRNQLLTIALIGKDTVSSVAPLGL